MRTYRCIGKPTTTDSLGRVIKAKPACGWEGEGPDEQTTFCPACGGWLELTKFEPTGGGDAHAPKRTGDRRGSGPHVTGPAGAIPPTPAGPPHGFNQTIQDLLYPDVDGYRSCVGCGAVPGRGHAPIGHAPIVECPVQQLEALLDAYETLRDQRQETGPPDPELDQDRRVIAKATPGRWIRCGVEGSAIIPGQADVRFFNGIPPVEERIALLGYPRGPDDPWEVGAAAKDANATFVARARTRWPQLVEQVAGLQAQVKRLQDLLGRSFRAVARDEYGNCTYCHQPASNERHQHCWHCGLRQPGHLDDCPIGQALDPAAAPERGGGDG